MNQEVLQQEIQDSKKWHDSENDTIYRRDLKIRTELINYLFGKSEES
jgi:hypothetical protein